MADMRHPGHLEILEDWHEELSSRGVVRRERQAQRRIAGPGTAGWAARTTPGFIGHVINKKAEVIRVYPPPDANTLLSVTDHCLRSRNYVNVMV